MGPAVGLGLGETELDALGAPDDAPPDPHAAVSIATAVSTPSGQRREPKPPANHLSTET